MKNTTLIILFLLFNIKTYAQIRSTNSDSITFYNFYNNFNKAKIIEDSLVLLNKEEKYNWIKSEYVEKYLGVPYNLHELNSRNGYRSNFSIETDSFFIVVYKETYKSLPYIWYMYLITYSKSNYKPISKFLFSGRSKDDFEIISNINSKLEISSKIMIKAYDEGTFFPDKCPDCFEIREIIYKYKIKNDGEIVIINKQPAYLYLAKFGNYELGEAFFNYPIIMDVPDFDKYYKREKRNVDK